MKNDTLNKHKKRIMIDLDGVLNQYKGKFDKNYIPPLKDGARNFLEELSVKYELKLFTTRDSNQTQKWLDDNELNKYFNGITNIKEPCYLIIDDRCMKFEGSYDEMLKKIDNYRPWWK